jgi:hypothetical protein
VRQTLSRSAAAIAAACLLTACGGDGGGGDSGTSTGSAQGTTTATDSGSDSGGDSASDALSEAAAADRYTELIAPTNDALTRLQGALEAQPLRVPAVQEAATGFIEADEDLIDDLSSTNWPESVDADMALLISSDQRLLDELRPLADAESAEDLQAWEREHLVGFGGAVNDTQGAVTSIRATLGLPPLGEST